MPTNDPERHGTIWRRIMTSLSSAIAALRAALASNSRLRTRNLHLTAIARRSNERADLRQRILHAKLDELNEARANEHEHRRTLADLEHAHRSELADRDHEIALLNGQIDVMEDQLRLLAAWQEKWQQRMEAEAAISATRKVTAEIGRVNDQEL